MEHSRCKQSSVMLVDEIMGEWGKNLNSTVLVSMERWVWMSSLTVFGFGENKTLKYLLDLIPKLGKLFVSEF